jgi:hypothetical protein
MECPLLKRLQMLSMKLRFQMHTARSPRIHRSESKLSIPNNGMLISDVRRDDEIIKCDMHKRKCTLPYLLQYKVECQDLQSASITVCPILYPPDRRIDSDMSHGLGNYFFSPSRYKRSPLTRLRFRLTSQTSALVRLERPLFALASHSLSEGGTTISPSDVQE